MYFFCCSAGWVGQDGTPPLSSLMDAGPVNRCLCWNRCLLTKIAAAKALFHRWKAARKNIRRTLCNGSYIKSYYQSLFVRTMKMERFCYSVGLVMKILN